MTVDDTDVWQKLSADKQRQERIRNRLQSLRSGGDANSTCSGGSDHNNSIGSRNSASSAAATNYAHSSVLASQEEARQHGLHRATTSHDVKPAEETNDFQKHRTANVRGQNSRLSRVSSSRLASAFASDAASAPSGDESWLQSPEPTSRPTLGHIEANYSQHAGMVENLSPLTVATIPREGLMSAHRTPTLSNARLSGGPFGTQQFPLPVYREDSSASEMNHSNFPQEPASLSTPNNIANNIASSNGSGSLGYIDPVQRKLQQYDQESRSAGSGRRSAARRARGQQQQGNTWPDGSIGDSSAVQHPMHLSASQPSTRSVVSNLSLDSLPSIGTHTSGGTTSLGDSDQATTSSKGMQSSGPPSLVEDSRTDAVSQHAASVSAGYGHSGVNSASNSEDAVARKLEQEEQERAIAAGVSNGQVDSETLDERLERKLNEDIEKIIAQRNPPRAISTEASGMSSASAPVHPRHQEGGSRPGAVSVDGPEARSSSQRDSRPRVDMSARPMVRRESSTGVLAVAAMIVEDYESEQLSEKQRELQEKEAALAAKMAQLQAWEEELEQKRRELETGHGTIVQAEVIDNSISDSYSGSASGGWVGLFAGRTSNNSYTEPEDEYVSMPFTTMQHQTSGVVDLQLAEMEVGPGPMRFAPRDEPSLEEQLSALDMRDRRAYKNMMQRLSDYKAKHVAYGSGKKRSKKGAAVDFPIEWQLRFLRHHRTKDGQFHEDNAYRAIIKMQKRFMNLRVHPLFEQLKSKTLFPVPGLHTKDGHEMFYMRPSRYFPSQTTARTIIDNLCYVMNTMLEKVHPQNEGIGFIACMDDWKMKNFDVNYCYQFMMGLQGVMIPVKTQLFLIVNPPVWFGAVWRIMKPMLAPSFRKRVKICPESKISKYLASDYEQYLPDDMKTGKADTDAMVRDFILFRQYLEKNDYQGSAASVSEGDDGSSQYSDSLSVHHHNFTGTDGGSDGRLRPGNRSTSNSSAATSQFRSVGSSSVTGSNRSGEASIHCDIDGDDDDASIGCEIDKEDDLSHEYDAKPAARPKRQMDEDYMQSKPNPGEQPFGEGIISASVTPVFDHKVAPLAPPVASIPVSSSFDDSVSTLGSFMPSSFSHHAKAPPSAMSTSVQSHTSTGSADSGPSGGVLQHPPSYHPANKEPTVGPGAMRFAPHGERSLEDQLFDLGVPDKRAYKNLKQRWEDYCAKQHAYGGGRKGKSPSNGKVTTSMPTEWLIRFLRHTSKKDGSFHEDRAFRAMMKFEADRYLKLRVFSMTKQLNSKTLFPVPGLKTREGGHDMFYMRPSRYFPKKTSVKKIINNLVYVMNTLLEKEHAQKEGIGFIACMDDWKMKNFDVNYCYQFMMALQGAMVPVKVQLFLIVNPPSWFGVIWRIMKPMLAPSFRKKVKICQEHKISKYLQDDFEQYLPDDMQSGRVDTNTIVTDFIAYRRFVEWRDRGDVHEDEEEDDMSTSQVSDGNSSMHSAWKQHQFRMPNPGSSSAVSSQWMEASDNISRMSMAESAAASSHDGGHGHHDDDASIEADINNELDEDLLNTGW